VIVRRFFLLLAAAMAFAVCAGVCVVALAFALYALIVPHLGAAGASGVVAGASALTVGLGALILAFGARAKRPRNRPAGASGLVERGLEMIKEKPVVAIVAAVGAGLLAVRDPKYLGAAMRSFVEGKATPRR
jgi:hypothetical protein